MRKAYLSVDWVSVDILAIISVFLAILALIWMGWIDLKLWILPNELVALLALTALPFHFATDWFFGGWLYFIAGAIVGGGVLYGIRYVANRVYGFETMGLGDVKLMAAVGLWLGVDAVMMALAVGALCGVLHAVGLAIYQKQSLKRMMLPAGPGFIAGSLIVGFWTLKDILI